MAQLHDSTQQVPRKDAHNMATSPDERWLHSLVGVLENFRKDGQNPTSLQVILFLHAARHDGEKGLKELAEMAGVEISTAHNALKMFSEGRGQSAAFAGLLEDVPSPTDGRAKNKRLTIAGRRFLQKIRLNVEQLAWSIAPRPGESIQ